MIYYINNVINIIGKEIINNDKGRKIFHLNFINISYRNRGNVPRIHNIVNVIIINIELLMIELIEEKNIIVDKILKINMFIYSARKINANHPPIYSTLNPDTSSDSPSAKSKGLRLVSAKQEIIHIVNIIILPQKKYNISCDIEICVSEYEFDIITINRIIKKNETSYEIIWATLRIAPMYLYFEFADHPINIIK